MPAADDWNTSGTARVTYEDRDLPVICVTNALLVHFARWQNTRFAFCTTRRIGAARVPEKSVGPFGDARKLAAQGDLIWRRGREY